MKFALEQPPIPLSDRIIPLSYLQNEVHSCPMSQTLNWGKSPLQTQTYNDCESGLLSWQTKRDSNSISVTLRTHPLGTGCISFRDSKSQMRDYPRGGLVILHGIGDDILLVKVGERFVKANDALKGRQGIRLFWR
jgi:hypothetical protein